MMIFPRFGCTRRPTLSRRSLEDDKRDKEKVCVKVMAGVCTYVSPCVSAHRGSNKH